MPQILHRVAPQAHCLWFRTYRVITSTEREKSAIERERMNLDTSVKPEVLTKIEHLDVLHYLNILVERIAMMMMRLPMMVPIVIVVMMITQIL